MLFLIGLIPVIIAIIYIALSKQAEEEEFERRERKYHRKDIRNSFPKAYFEFWGKPEIANSVFRKYSKTILSDDCEKWTNSEWRILENHLNEIEKNKSRANLENTFYLMDTINEITKKYPYGLHEYMKHHPQSKAQEIADNIQIIIDFDKEIRSKSHINTNDEQSNIQSNNNSFETQFIPYVIISIEPFIKIKGMNRSLLVKVNEVIKQKTNDEITGMSYSSEESENTRWLVFEYTDLNLAQLKVIARKCEEGRFWDLSKLSLKPTWVEYYDNTKKKDISHKIEIAFFV